MRMPFSAATSLIICLMVIARKRTFEDAIRYGTATAEVLVQPDHDVAFGAAISQTLEPLARVPERLSPVMIV